MGKNDLLHSTILQLGSLNNSVICKSQAGLQKDINYIVKRRIRSDMDNDKFVNFESRHAGEVNPTGTHN